MSEDKIKIILSEIHQGTEKGVVVKGKTHVAFITSLLLGYHVEHRVTPMPNDEYAIRYAPERHDMILEEYGAPRPVKDVPEDAFDVSGLVEDYGQIEADFGGIGVYDEDDVEKLVRMLQDDHDWNRSTAKRLVKLARKYGSFVLRNALALAIVLDIEDGSAGL